MELHAVSGEVVLPVRWSVRSLGTFPKPWESEDVLESFIKDALAG
jgi:hypothetical protein